jgi:hypothetical protein
MTLLIAVPLATMCVGLLGVFLSLFALGATGRRIHPLDYFSAIALWSCFVVAILSGSAAAVIKLATIFAGTP